MDTQYVPSWPGVGGIFFPPSVYRYGQRRPKRRRRGWIYDKSTGMWYAAVTVDSSGVQGSGGVIGADNATVSVTNTAGNFMLVSGVMTGQTFATATFDGASLYQTMLPAVANNGYTGEMWGLKVPSTGTHDLVVNLTGVDNFVLVVAFFTGVDQTTPLGTCVRAAYNASGTSHNHPVTNAANGLVWDSFGIDTGAGTVTLDSGQTLQAAATDASNIRAVVSSKTGTGVLSLGYSWPNDFFRWTQQSAPINPLASVVNLDFLGQEPHRRPNNPLNISY